MRGGWFEGKRACAAFSAGSSAPLSRVVHATAAAGDSSMAAAKATAAAEKSTAVDAKATAATTDEKVTTIAPDEKVTAVATALDDKLVKEEAADENPTATAATIDARAPDATRSKLPLDRRTRTLPCARP